MGIRANPGEQLVNPNPREMRANLNSGVVSIVGKIGHAATGFTEKASWLDNGLGTLSALQPSLSPHAQFAPWKKCAASRVVDGPAYCIDDLH
jgi:hypothetical protein